MRTKLRVIVIVLSMALISALVIPTASPAMATQEMAEEVTPQRTINVSGSGQVSVPPDVAVVTLGVETQADEAAAALAENSEQMQALVEALLDADIAAEDIQTQVVRLHPRYGERVGEEDERELIGYRATNLVEARLRDLAAVGEILDAAVEAGGDRIEGIRFELSDPSDYLDEARESAWNNALHKAEQLATLAGVELGAVLTINETDRGIVPMMEHAVALEAQVRVPIEPGRQTIGVDLQVTWLLQEKE